MSVEHTNIGKPEKIKIYKNFQQLRIIRRWFGIKYILLTVFVIAWVAIAFTWYAVVFSFPSQGVFDSVFNLYFDLMPGAVGIGLAYYVLVGYFNKTTIDVDFNSVTVRQGPLPFLGNKKVPSKKITQLYCTRDVVSYNRGLFHTFIVRAITSERRNIKLISGLDTSEQALFIEQEIEKFLKIEDKRVKGEIW